MRVVLAIAAKDLRQRLRDRSAWVLVFLAPVLISALMALAFNNNEEFRANIGMVDLDRGPAATGLTQVLESAELQGTVQVRSYDTETAARRAVEAGDVHTAIVVPEGFTASLHGTSAQPVRVLDSVGFGLQAQLARGHRVLRAVPDAGTGARGGPGAGHRPGHAGRLHVAPGPRPRLAAHRGARGAPRLGRRRLDDAAVA
ncbi:ABC transporter permease [Streptomyces sp. NPDC051243]|uniref:ABC transporter permease n=1 Tax=Streptomyces sp. NPDC051243 TaxID=3365646 RepID=UPI0037B61291